MGQSQRTQFHSSDYVVYTFIMTAAGEAYYMY